MTNQVTAIVLAHDEPQLLSRTLKQLTTQSVKPNQILVVDTSNTALENIPFQSLKLHPKTSFAAAISLAVENAQPTGLIWILHDDSAPHPDALEKLLQKFELSPSLAVVGPKQIDWDNPKIIRQLGLTLTSSGKILNRVSGEYDQGQHDNLEDVLAVGTAGALISVETLQRLGGFNPYAPVLATDIDFSIRARLNGQRVVVAPAARVDHAMYSIRGKRRRSWLKSSPKVANRHAELHLKLSYANFFVFIFRWLALVPKSILLSLWFLLIKQSGEIGAELIGSFKTFLSIFKILGSRNLIRKTTSFKIRKLKTLRATRAQVRESKQKGSDLLVTQDLLAAHSQSQNEDRVQSSDSGLIASGAFWWALGLALLNIAWLPTGIAVSGHGTLPLSASWLEVFSHAGSSASELGLGFTGPADPFVWALSLVSAVTFFEPTLALTLILFFAAPLAFIGAFTLVGSVASNATVKTVSALSYALWPSMTIAIGQSSFPVVLVQILLPWLALGIAKLAGLTEKNRGRGSSSWSVLGITAIGFAVASASSPVFGTFVLVVLLALAIARPKRSGFLLAVPTLAVLWFLPLVAFYQSRGAGLLAILADPGLIREPTLRADWSLMFFGFNGDFSSFELFLIAPALILALLAFFTAKFKQSIVLWLITLAAWVCAWLGLLVEFKSGEDFSYNPEVLPILSVAGLMITLLMAITMEGIRGLRLVASILVVVLGLIPASVALVMNRPAVGYSDGRVMPSIIAADSATGANFGTMKLSLQPNGVIGSEVIWGDGLKFDELSSTYRMSRTELQETDPRYQTLGQLVANLISANGLDLRDSFSELGISYVLVSPANDELSQALDSTGNLESIGQTDFGQLWKVRSARYLPLEATPKFSASKIAQLATLAFFLILAIPTKSTRKRRNSESQIFVESEEEGLT